MTTDMRTILSRVASGDLTPEEAQTLLQAAAVPTAALPVPLPVRGLVIRASGVRLIVLADPTVATAVADGPHRVEHDGDRLVIQSDLSAGEYQAEAPRSAFMTWIAAAGRAGSTLRVRVNPELPLEVLSVTGALEISGVRAPLAVGVEAGSARLSGGCGPVSLSVSTGSADVEWQFTGNSTVTAELGSAKVAVLPGSDVVVSAESSLGSAQIRTADGVRKAPPTGTAEGITIGSGSGSLKVTAKLGSVDVRIA